MKFVKVSPYVKFDSPLGGPRGKALKQYERFTKDSNFVGYLDRVDYCLPGADPLYCRFTDWIPQLFEWYKQGVSAPEAAQEMHLD